VPTLTYISTANVVLFQGAEVKLCECDPLTYNVRVEDLERVVTPRTKAIITVDMNGLPIDYDPIVAWARARGITVIADSAESRGSGYRG
jgi:dTDP-4-amino-4,6-dideoxygalactose transaminase